MSDELARAVTQMARARAEAAPLEDFPLRDQAPGKIEGAIPLQASPEAEQGRVEIEGLGRGPRLTEAEYAERKRKLPPLMLAPKRAKGFLTFDRNRRDIADDRARVEAEAKARTDLSRAVSKMPMRWEKPK